MSLLQITIIFLTGAPVNLLYLAVSHSDVNGVYIICMC